MYDLEPDANDDLDNTRDEGSVTGSRDPDFEELSLPDIARHVQTTAIPIPMQDPALLPLTFLDPESLERLIAEMVSRQDNLGCQFYGRRGQKQYGLDIVELETPGTRTLYQLKRFQTLRDATIRAAVVDYAGEPRLKGHVEENHRFGPRRFVLVSSAEFDSDTGNVDELARLQIAYEDDLAIEVWGAETLSRKLRDAPRLVLALFGPAWAKAYCGFEPGPDEESAPNPLGLLEGPIAILRLDALEADATASQETEPLTSARLYGVVATGLDAGNFPGHAELMRRRQATAAQSGGDINAAFSIRFGMATAHVLAGEDFVFGSLRRELLDMEPLLDCVQQQKLSVLVSVADWYEHGSALHTTVPALAAIHSARDPDIGMLCCLVLEQAIVDGLYDFDPPHSVVVGTDVDSPQLLTQLRQLGMELTHSDPAIRARLRCAVADASLSESSTSQEVELAYQGIVADAAAGRMLHARGLIASRAGYAFAIRGNNARAETLWRQSILSSCEDGYYGDAHDAIRSVQLVTRESGHFAVNGLDIAMSALPNRRRLLAGTHDPALSAFEDAHKGRLVEAFGDTRRFLWEGRLSGHLQEELLALSLFGDVLHDGERPVEAAQSYVMAGDGTKATEVAALLPEPVAVLRWASSGSRRRRAAVAQVLKVQAPLIHDDDVTLMVNALLDMAIELWTSTIVSPQVEQDALMAVAAFGIRIPESVVDKILAIAGPALSAFTGASETIATLLVQTYWAVASRRQELAAAINLMLQLPTPPFKLWGFLRGIPSVGRADLLPIVQMHAEANEPEAIITLAAWREESSAMQIAARQACSALLRRPVGLGDGTTFVGTQEYATVELLLALLETDRLVDVDPSELTQAKSQPAGGILFSTSVTNQGDAPEHDDKSSAKGTRSPSDEATRGDQRGTARAADEVDEVAALAASSPLVLTELVANKLVLLTEDRAAGASSRVQAISALRLILDKVSPDCAADISDRLAAVHQEPDLSEMDQFEIDSNTPFSRMRLNTGADELADFALLGSSEALRYILASAKELKDSDRDNVDSRAASAAVLLRGDSERTRLLGAHTLAALSLASPEFGSLMNALLYHSDEEVRAVGAKNATMSAHMFETMAVDPSVSVRSALARRRVELPEAVQRQLEYDSHLVVRYLASRSHDGDQDRARLIEDDPNRVVAPEESTEQ
jgi:hypothetical protein